MSAFQRKLHKLVGAAPLGEWAREHGLSRSTVYNWLDGVPPNTRGIESLAQRTGTTPGYWVNDDADPMDETTVRLGKVPGVSSSSARSEFKDAGYVLRIEKLKVMSVRDDSCEPMIRKGMYVIFDVGPSAEAKDGDVVVVDVGVSEDEWLVRRRFTRGTMRVYTAMNTLYPPLLADVGTIRAEYPVCAVASERCMARFDENMPAVQTG